MSAVEHDLHNEERYVEWSGIRDLIQDNAVDMLNRKGTVRTVSGVRFRVKRRWHIEAKSEEWKGIGTLSTHASGVNEEG